MLILRPIEPGDLEDLLRLADLLDSMNLPRDREFLAGRIELSLRSFACKLDPGEPGTYVFVLEDTETGRCIGSSTVMAKHGVDGIYDADPNLVPDAHRFQTLSYMEAISRRLEVMDSTALSLCMENELPIIVFDIDAKDGIVKAVRGEQTGTYVCSDETVMAGV